MAKIVAVFLLFSFLNSCKGFDFTLDVSVRVLSDGSNTLQPCGVLQCNETQDRSPNQIKSLTVYKKVVESDATESWQQLASITSERASERKMSKGARIVGQLTDYDAYLTLDLVDTHDCKSSQFLCVVALEDEEKKSLKKILVGKRVDPDSSENFSIQKPKDSSRQVNRRDAQSSSAGASLYLMNPFQIKLDRIESRLEDALKNLENRLEDKIGDLKAAVIDRIDRGETDIENKLGETESKTDRLENRFEDKLGQLDIRVTEIMVLIKAAATGANDNAYNLLASKIDRLENKLKDTLSQLESYVSGISKKEENIKDTGDRLFEQLATVISTVQSLEKNFTCSGHQIHQTDVGAGQSALTVSAENTKLSQLVTSVASLTDLTQNLLTRVQTFSNSYAGGTLVPVDEFSDPLGSGKKEWRLVFRGTAYNNVKLYQAYMHGTGIPLEVEQGCKQFNKSLPCVNHYRNRDALDNWVKIDEVLFAIYKDDEIVKRVVFNGRGSTYTSWFHAGRVILSSWDDLTTQPHNFFSIIGETHPTAKRRFFMSLDYDKGCDGYRGWFFAFDILDSGCAAEKTVVIPTFLYAVGNTFAVWTSANKALADAIGIFVKYE